MAETTTNPGGHNRDLRDITTTTRSLNDAELFYHRYAGAVENYALRLLQACRVRNPKDDAENIAAVISEAFLDGRLVASPRTVLLWRLRQLAETCRITAEVHTELTQLIGQQFPDHEEGALVGWIPGKCSFRQYLQKAIRNRVWDILRARDALPLPEDVALPEAGNPLEPDTYDDPDFTKPLSKAFLEQLLAHLKLHDERYKSRCAEIIRALYSVYESGGKSHKRVPYAELAVQLGEKNSDAFRKRVRQALRRAREIALTLLRRQYPSGTADDTLEDELRLRGLHDLLGPSNNDDAEPDEKSDEQPNEE
jgi:hypothetical protein